VGGGGWFGGQVGTGGGFFLKNGRKLGGGFVFGFWDFVVGGVCPVFFLLGGGGGVLWGGVVVRAVGVARVVGRAFPFRWFGALTPGIWGGEWNPET